MTEKSEKNKLKSAQKVFKKSALPIFKRPKYRTFAKPEVIHAFHMTGSRHSMQTFFSSTYNSSCKNAFFVI